MKKYKLKYIATAIMIVLLLSSVITELIEMI